MPDIPLHDNQGYLLEMYDERSFSCDVIAAFPELRDDLEDFPNLLHVQIGTLAEAMRQSLKNGQFEYACRILAFLERAINHPRAINEISNGVTISFISAAELRSVPAVWGSSESVAPRIRQILLDTENAEADP
jgi:hypothetical protein